MFFFFCVAVLLHIETELNIVLKCVDLSRDLKRGFCFCFYDFSFFVLFVFYVVVFVFAYPLSYSKTARIGKATRINCATN